MRALHLLTEPERKAKLRRAIVGLVPCIPPDCLDYICRSVNTKRHYLIKHTVSKQRFLNLATRETIVTADNRTFSEVMPLYGSFQCPYFEKIGETRFSREGSMDPSVPAAAVKIRAGTENQRTSATYTLLIYLPGT